MVIVAFSNVGYTAPQATRTCFRKTSMNTVMVDMTVLTISKPGDEVVFFGKQGNSEITAEEIEEDISVHCLPKCQFYGSNQPTGIS